MQLRDLRDNIIAILALIVLPTSAYGLDAALHRWRLYAQSTLDMLPYFWGQVLASLPVAFVVLAFAYWLVTRSAAHRLVGLVYLIVGVLAVIYVPLVFTFHLRLPLLLATLSGPISYTYFTGSVMAIAGAFHLLRRRPA
jgi:hypothetical protein